jgi:hypothetical protein
MSEYYVVKFEDGIRICIALGWINLEPRTKILALQF